ncbi:MAG: 30S ribosomal protein S20 [Verrucomicrobia bacterium]|nr:30S ribosomal protein S20 [Verrucomicrobiota bacterium]
MANTKSAAKALRSSGRKRLQNKSVKTALHSIEKRFLSLIAEGKKDDATKLFPEVSSALDKAAKRGVIHANHASRQKSRSAVRLAKVAAPAAAAK